MRSFFKLFFVQAKLYLREPIAAFFTIFYAPLALLLFGAIYGNKPIPEFGGRGSMDIGVPAYVGLIIVTVGLMSVPIQTAQNREAGVLRRYRATPLKPVTYLATEVLMYFAMTLLGVLLLFLVGKIAFDIHFEGNVLSVLGGFVLGSLSFFAFGFLVASLAPNARVAQTVGMVLAFPMMFISGATVPLELLPTTVRKVANFVPLTHVVTLLRGLWVGDPWGKHWVEVVVLGGLLVASTAIAALTFRWE